MKPTSEFLLDLKALCHKHNVKLIGADYHDGILVEPHVWTDKTNLVIEDTDENESMITISDFEWV